MANSKGEKKPQQMLTQWWGKGNFMYSHNGDKYGEI